MKKIRAFGGKLRVELPDGELENISEEDLDLSEDDREEVADIIKEGFEQLSDSQRRIFEMVISGISESEVAIMLGISLNNVKMQYNRAKKKLRKFVTHKARRSIYIESMLRRIANEKRKQSNTDGITE